jgi:anthranilate synthase component II
MKIAVIDNFDSFVYNLIRYLKEFSCDVIVMRNNEIDDSELDRCDAILLSPGPGIPSDFVGLLNVIKKYSLSKPILGICLGHQALAEYFENELKANNSPIHGEASELEILVIDEVFVGISNKTKVGRYHSWSVKHPLKPPLVCTGITEKSEIMSFKHSDLPIHGLQFHPESILTPEGKKMIGNWVKSIHQNKKSNERITK